MCWQLYLASDEELHHVEWDEAAPAFNTQELSEYEKLVRTQFSLPHVIYMGSHEGCSCGFFASEREKTEDRKNRERNNQALSQYLKEALQDGSHLEMFLCWQGGETEPIVGRKQLTPEDFIATEFPLNENEFATVVP